MRNLYAQGTYDNITMWAGSRMYRGDDIYLLNWWPLDNQNTVGGGIGAPIYKTERPGHAVRDDPPVPRGPAAPRQPVPVPADPGRRAVRLRHRRRHEARSSAHHRDGEAHAVRPPGRRHGGLQGDPLRRAPPARGGHVQRSAHQGRSRTARATPAGCSARSSRTSRASATRTRRSCCVTRAASPPTIRSPSRSRSRSIARPAARARRRSRISGNYEQERSRSLGAAYVRFFRDGSTGRHVDAEVRRGRGRRSSERLPRRLLRRLARRQLPAAPHRDAHAGRETIRSNASVTKFGVIPYFSPSGRGSYKRPQIRLLYVASFRDSRHARAIPGRGRLRAAQGRALPRPRRRVVVQLELVSVRRTMRTMRVESRRCGSVRGRVRAPGDRLRHRPGRRQAARARARTSTTGVTRSSTRCSSTASPTAT